MMITYFKVVRNENGNRKSLYDFSYLTAEYSIGNWTFPKAGRLFVFSTIEEAEACRITHDLYCSSAQIKFEIWEVEVVEPRKMKWGCKSTSPEAITVYWLNWMHKKSSHRRQLHGSVYGAKRVKLIRRIEK